MYVKLCLFFLLFCFILATAESRVVVAKPGCQSKCGKITIPYPFGIGSKCSIDGWAEVVCDTTFNPPKLFFTHSIPYQIVEFSVLTTYDTFFDTLPPFVRVKNNISTVCSGAISSSYDSFLPLTNTPFNLSITNNQFTVIGCGMYGIIDATLSYNDLGAFSSGCMTLCNGMTDLAEGECSGTGCCNIGLPWGIRVPGIHLDTLNISGIRTSNTRCGSAFLAEREYKFKPSHIESLKESTVVLEFRIWNRTCDSPSSLPCALNSLCRDVFNVHGPQYPTAGYTCLCPPGYEGNPYLDPGCQDINECDQPEKNPCLQSYRCINTPGSFTCVHVQRKRKPFIWIIFGVGLGLFLLGGSVWMYYIKRKQLFKLSEKLARLNARLTLIQEISSNAKIYTARKLEQATNDFHPSRILGQGGYGTVYKGILSDQSIVAIKKSKIIEKSQFDEFINEVAILTKIDHRNIVKLLGCSAETEHPLLVYEFVSNGTLSDHIFKKSGMPYLSMSWENRLRIATEIAGALAYLHSAASIPIIHRDVKSSNILLDDHLTAKVADFGVSRLNRLDQTEISTLVKGTPGYLDPEYMQTGQLTEKSDVFSFGVVLAELLTGKKSISFERAQGERNLAIYFTMSMNEERLLHIVEEGMVNEENIRSVQAVAVLVQRCLNFKGEERPSMKEVASELETLRGFNKKQFSSQTTNEEGNSFTSNQVNHYNRSMCSNGASGSLATKSMMSLTLPR